MALYFIGLGLADETDITVKGLELIKKSDVVYFENYTSILQCSVKKLEDTFGRKIIPARREVIENSQKILDEAKQKNVAILVIGDPLVATTHAELFLQAKKQNIPVHVAHNASVASAIGCTGLQVYKFGRIISIPFQTNAASFFDMCLQNKKTGLHTLLLLDLDVACNKFLSIKEAIEKLQTAENNRKAKILTTLIGCARIGAQDQLIAAGSPEKLKTINWGKPPYCLVIPGELHFLEEEALQLLS
ncbi:MAG: diphthine synthase [Candidatus Aenigmarchaeota archaeon]|nr:diphthine synthase [Candidatus Aenigmarchaeota archaeon]